MIKTALRRKKETTDCLYPKSQMKVEVQIKTKMKPLSFQLSETTKLAINWQRPPHSKEIRYDTTQQLPISTY